MKKLFLVLVPLISFNIWISGNADEVPVYEFYGTTCSEELYHFTFTTDINTLSNSEQKKLSQLLILSVCNLQPESFFVHDNTFIYIPFYKNKRIPGSAKDLILREPGKFIPKRAPPVPA